ncbi:hypothetical protein [Stratiformator vulcanicus]|uniref:Uncharacterized protein n=1 Tax=Stratiformator vulcanicus TaxID=2527980 RepID=A0A517R2E6_9PLAN|nr:hypothetical protein [Stratiformator vulcanicus]QDT38034.1 hypothetical protein Pan189_24190 [Stratiformator vulcanicus]
MRIKHFTAAAALMAVGYLLGMSLHSGNSVARAQVADLSEDNAEQLRQAYRLMSIVQTSLETRGKYTPAIQGINPMAVYAGGLDAVGDLEGGRGVDPVTFAGLYGGLAVGPVNEELGYDEQGRLTYKDRVVRMYPVRKIKQLFSERTALLQGVDN